MEIVISALIAASWMSSGHAFAATCPAGTGPYCLQNQQPVDHMPYPNGIWHKPLPSNKMSQVMANSGVIINALFTQNNGSGPQYSYPWTRRQGAATIAPLSSPGHDGCNAPFYYGQATDPVYIVRSSHPPGPNSPTGKTFHAPSGAPYNFCRGDGYINIWDQTTNLLFSDYTWSTSWLKLPSCPGNGHAGTQADPCPVDWGGYNGVFNWSTDLGYGWVGGDSLPNGGWGTHIRAQEIMSGPINHALFLYSDCMAGSVFPGKGSSVTLCPAGVNRPPFGSLLFLDYTPAQLADLKTKLPLWQYRIIEALTNYGGYFGEASYHVFPGGSSLPVVGRFEGPAAYEKLGVPYPLYAWFKSFPHDPANGDPSKPIACYTYGTFTGCDINPYVNVPLYTGPACPTAACDISKHMHIANECIALGMAGKPGGCYAGGSLANAVPAKVKGLRWR